MNNTEATFNYWCLNSSCPEKSLIPITKERSNMEDPEHCIECGSPLKLAGEKLGGGIGKFKAMSSTERSAVLAKRSHEHFKREGREVKRQKLKDSGLSYDHV